MTKLLLILTASIFAFSSCGSQSPQEKRNVASTGQKVDTSEYKGLHGTWVRHNKTGFTLIEIKDTSNILYYQFLDQYRQSNRFSTLNSYFASMQRLS